MAKNQHDKTKNTTIQEKTSSTFYVSSKNDIKSNIGQHFILKKFSANGDGISKNMKDRYEEKSYNRLKSGKLDFR